LESAGATVTVKQLETASGVHSNRVHRAIHELRPKLHDSIKEQRLIGTVTEEPKGYRFVVLPEVATTDISDVTLPVRATDHDLKASENLDLSGPTNSISASEASSIDPQRAAESTLDKELNEQQRTPLDVPSDRQHLERKDVTPERLSTEARTPTRQKAGAETFEGWIGGRGIATFVILVILVVVAVVVSFSIASPWENPNDSAALESARKAAASAQCVVILLLLLLSLVWKKARGFDPNRHYTNFEVRKAGYKNVADFESDRDDLKGALRKHTVCWLALLLTWIPLYVLLATANLDTDWAKKLLIIFNVVNTTALVVGFSVLNKNSDDEDKQHRPGAVLNILVFFILFVLLAFLIKTQKYDGAILLTGIASGVFMALYVGRLQSKFIGPHMWVVYLLYSYTAIQPLVLYLKDNPEWAWIILDATLFLKCLLYLYMAWLFESGLLLFYFARIKRTSGPLRKQREAFQNLLN